MCFWSRSRSDVGEAAIPKSLICFGDQHCGGARFHECFKNCYDIIPFIFVTQHSQRTTSSLDIIPCQVIVQMSWDEVTLMHQVYRPGWAGWITLSWSILYDMNLSRFDCNIGVSPHLTRAVKLWTHEPRPWPMHVNQTVIQGDGSSSSSDSGDLPDFMVENFAKGVSWHLIPTMGWD